MRSAAIISAEDETQRDRRWQMLLPFPVQTVGKVEVIDRIFQGKLTTEYKYHYGYWDGAERADRPYKVTESLPGVREEVSLEERKVTLHDLAKFSDLR